ncbi:nucleoside monophosphate kinase [Haladaptatus cibarius]|uniref:nucleoside monophosphate kinase n=1 Tax=Haladaptatus cibarius TaxID=453847 RepID=UPI000679115E|nr:adenylate kinase [Haladaptatus cibarius]
MKHSKIILLGLPGAGKTTCARKLSAEFGLTEFDLGTILRENADVETAYGTPGEYMNRDELVPDELVNELVSKRLPADEFVLSGYPRTVTQVEHLGTITNVGFVCFLSASVEVLVERLRNRRIDPKTGTTYHLRANPPKSEAVANRLVQRQSDREELLKPRIEANQELLEPIVERYRTHPHFVTIDATRPPDVVYRTLAEKIASK